jgi:hypothetical protein
MTLTAEHTSFKINIDYELTGQDNQVAFSVSSMSHDFPQKFIKIEFEGNPAATLLNAAADLGQEFVAEKLIG